MAAPAPHSGLADDWPNTLSHQLVVTGGARPSMHVDAMRAYLEEAFRFCADVYAV